MKVSCNWLQNYFNSPLPDAQSLADALTFHAFEIESVELASAQGSGEAKGDWILDVKVTPNRGHDCLSHRSIAKELSAILNIPMKNDPLRENVSLEPKSEVVRVRVEDSKLCPRFTGAYIKGVKVGPSPAWLRERLEAVGQKSINNIVDATNFVMFDIGQPLHAFDVGKLKKKGDTYALTIRLAKKEEKLVGLDDKEYTLSVSMLAIEDANAAEVVSVAGIKGGKPTGIDEATLGMFLEAANWDGVTIRKTSQALKLRTDASDRFQQVMSPEFAAYGTAAAAKLITELAGGEIVGYVDEYPDPQKQWSVSVSVEKINNTLGTSLTGADIADVFTRLGLPFEQKNREFVVHVPFERLDLTIPEDLIEEIGRIIGYDKIPSTELPPFPKKPEINANFYAAERTREDLMTKGYSEVFTSIFADKGERAVANKVGGEKPYLRTTLVDGLREAYERNDRTKDLLGLTEVKLFEIGAVWKDGKETVVVGTADASGTHETSLKLESTDAYEDLPTSTLGRYESFSRYPFIVRDIAMWVPDNPDAVSKVLAVFASEAGMLLRHVHLFDQFKKDERVSYAFRLVLQSFEKTLTDEEANTVMERIYASVKAQGWEVR